MGGPCHSRCHNDCSINVLLKTIATILLVMYLLVPAAAWDHVPKIFNDLKPFLPDIFKNTMLENIFFFMHGG